MAKCVMIVDDSFSVRAVMGIALRGAGYEVLEAADGSEALTKLGARQVHLVISDVNMPGMDGLTFLKALKKQSAFKFTPVMMMSTDMDAEAVAEGKAAGALAWMPKPFQPERLLGVVQKLVRP